LNKTTNSPLIQAVYLDDDALMCKSWELVAKRRKVNLRCFNSWAAMREKLAEIPKDATLYVDSVLEPEDLKGEEVARELFELGYQSIYLATGFSPDRFPPMPWIKGIVGKEPPWI
jgi:hypothetical protein